MSVAAAQTSLIPRRVPLLSVLPPSVRARLSGQPLPDLRVPSQVLRRARIPQKIKVSDWALANRIVADGPHEGPWRHEYAPHTIKIMDTYAQPWVREIWFCGVEQSGKTNTMMNCLGWAIDCDPGNIYYLMPTEDTAAKIVGGKIKPLLHRSGRLTRLVSPRQDDTTLSRIHLRNGVTLFPAHANSASSMATWAAKHCFGDEVDKYPAMAGKEADPITLVKKRNRTYSGRYKRFFASTPAGMFISKGLAACHQIWEYRERCPHCQHLVRLEAEHLALAESDTVETVERDGCQVGCPTCGALWTEAERLRAIRTGAWIATKGGDLTRPARVGFHHRAWDCLDIPLNEIAAAWIKAQTGSLADKIAWANGYEAMDYVHEQRDRYEDQILRLVDPSHPRGIVPRETATLLLLVDTQRRGFFYQVLACGYGPDVATCLIDHGFVERFAHLADLSEREWLDPDGKGYRCQAAFIDSGGGTNPDHPKHSRTAEVYEFCRQNPSFKPLKGRRTQAQSWRVTRLDYYPSRDGRKVPLPGGINLYTINVTDYKNDLAHVLLVEPGGPGGLRLHADTRADYAAQMCAEYQDERGWWICPRNRANHHWDLGVYGRAAIDIMRLRDRRRKRKRPEVTVYSKGVEI